MDQLHVFQRRVTNFRRRSKSVATVESLLRILKEKTDHDDEFMVEEIFNGVTLGMTDRSILGYTINRAIKTGLIEHVGHRESQSPGHHGEIKSVWRRL